VSGNTTGNSFIAVALLGATLCAARAQSIEPPPRPEPVLGPGAAATVIGANAAAFDLGTRFLYNSSGQGGLGELAHMFGSPKPEWRRRCGDAATLALPRLAGGLWPAVTQ